jgi:hyperosmotically inducible periplasmic protein
MKKFLFLFLAAGLLSFYACKPKDADIKAGVETAISSVSGVSADVTDGVVSLTGTVASEEAKTQAETAAKAVKGVKSIANNIMVVLPVISGDPQLMEGLKTALAAFSGVTGAVKDSVVTLTGTAKKDDLQKIIMAVQALRPKKVENQITVQ